MTPLDHPVPHAARLAAVPARLAAAAGVAGIAVHLALAGDHAGHAPVLLAALVALALICVPCGLSLWRRPGDRAAWTTLLLISALMMLLHLGMDPEGPMVAVAVAVPAVQLLLGSVSLLPSFRRYGGRPGPRV